MELNEQNEINRSTSFEEEEFGSDSEMPLVQNPASQNIVKEMDLLKRFIKEIFKSKAQQKYFWMKANKGGKEGKKWKKMAKEFQASTPKSADLPKKVDEVMTPMGDTALGGTRAFIKSRKNVKKELNKEDRLERN